MPLVPERPLDRDSAKRELLARLSGGRVVYTRHFRDELRNDGLTMQDVLTVCRAGAIRRQAEIDLKTGLWKYRIEGSSDGRRLAVVFTFREDGAVFITVFEETR